MDAVILLLYYISTSDSIGIQQPDSAALRGHLALF